MSGEQHETAGGTICRRGTDRLRIQHRRSDGDSPNTQTLRQSSTRLGLTEKPGQTRPGLELGHSILVQDKAVLDERLERARRRQPGVRLEDRGMPVEGIERVQLTRDKRAVARKRKKLVRGQRA